MKEKKDIDRLFQEKFRDFESSPESEVWKNIKKELDDEKKNRGYILPLWAKIGGVAALLVLLVLVGRSLFFSSSSPSVVRSPEENMEKSSNPANPQNPVPSITRSEDSVGEGSAKGYAGGEAGKEDADSSGQKIDVNPNRPKSGLASDQFSTEKNNKQEKSRTAIAVGQNQLKGRQDSRNPVAPIRSRANKHNDLYDEIWAQLYSPVSTESDIRQRVDQTRLYQEIEQVKRDSTKENRLSLEEIARNNNRSEEKGTEEELLKNRFSVQPNMAPIFYNSTGGGSPVDPKFEDNAGQGETTVSYGVNLAYTVSKRVKLRTGVNQVKMGYNTKDIAFTPSAQLINLKGLQKSPKPQHLMVTENATKLKPQKADMLAYEKPYEKGKLNQQYEYIEVPVEMEFALLDERFGINLIGGFSTLFLNNDEINVISPNGRTNLGQASNLNSISFTTNVGLGFDYDLSEWMIFNVEPTFKYQLNGFSGDTGSFHPYYFGIYTGLIFRF